MTAPDGTWHPNNGHCVQVLRAAGKGAVKSWHAVTTSARMWSAGECAYLAGVLNMNRRTARVLDAEGNIA